jgi:hypothetical protein
MQHVFELKRLPAAFYATASENEPVRAWLKDQNEDDRRTIGQDIAAAEFGWPVGMPLCRSLGGGPFEKFGVTLAAAESRG